MSILTERKTTVDASTQTPPLKVVRTREALDRWIITFQHHIDQERKELDEKVKVVVAKTTFRGI